MMKAGASYRDKNRIKKFYNSGMENVEHLSSLTRIRPEHVKKIIAQLKKGKLKTRGGAKAGGGNYGDGDAA